MLHPIIRRVISLDEKSGYGGQNNVNYVLFATDVKNRFKFYRCFLVSGWTAVKYFSLILLIAILSLAGCESDKAPSADSRTQFGSSKG